MFLRAALSSSYKANPFTSLRFLTHTFQANARIDSSPAVASGRIYVGSSDGKLYILDATTGASVQQFEAGGPLTASPAIAGGRLVIGSQDGKLFCLGA